MSPDQFLVEVRALVLRELEDLDPSRLVFRLDGGAADRSVLVLARLGDGCAMVARVYEVDLPGGLQPVYLSPDDAALLVRSLGEWCAANSRAS